MILKDKYNQDINTDKIWGIEYRIKKEKNINYGNLYKQYRHEWYHFRSYKTQQAMFQALKDIRKSEMWSWANFRPYHVYYEL
jgi:hypothetical protein